MIVTDETRNTLRARSRIISTLRRALEDKDFLEVGGCASIGGRREGTCCRQGGGEYRLWEDRDFLEVGGEGEFSWGVSKG